MLKSIIINKFLILEDINIDFNNQLNVITGESGTGKSLFLKAIIYGLGLKDFNKELKNQDINIELKINHNQKEYQIKRQRENGKHNITLNNEKITLSDLKNITSNIFKIVSQNTFITLKDDSFAINYIDNFIDSNLILKTKNNYHDFQKLLKRKKELEQLLEDRDSKLELINFKIDELRKLNLSEDDSFIEEKINEIKNYSKISNALNISLSILGENEINLYSLLEDLKHQLNIIDLDITPIKEINQLISKIESSINVKSKELSNQEDLDYLINRLENLQNAARKYRCKISDLMSIQNNFENEIKELSNIDRDLESIESKISHLESLLKINCKKLNDERIKVSIDLEKYMNNELKSLNMKGAEFKIQIDKCNLNELGSDKVSFLLKSNKGLDFMPLSLVASGGELNRILLSLEIKNIDDKVIIFDEIDSGIGGQTGALIGHKIKNISKKTQTILITHLAQIAALGDNHIYVEKENSKNKTNSFIREIKESNRVEEIARMLSGKISEESKNLAKDLLNN